MKQNIQNKRRAFHNQIRNTQRNNIFNRLRKKAFCIPTQNINHLTLDEIMSSLPISLPQLFEFIKVKQSQSCLTTNYLIKTLPEWISNCKHKVLDIQLWSNLTQISIKMLQNCQNSFDKQMVISYSEEIVINRAICLSEQNKSLKYDIFLLILDYYLIGLTSLQACKRSKNHIKTVISSLQTMNWRTKNKELIKYVYFFNNLLDLSISQNDQKFIYELFLQKSTILIHFITVIEQISSQSCQHQQQNLILLILISLVNLTFSINDRKIYKMIIATDFHIFLLSKIQEGQNSSFLISYYLQLITNLMLDYTQFRAFVKNQVDFSLHYNQNELNLLSEIKGLCNIEYE